MSAPFTFTPEDIRIVWNNNRGDLPSCDTLGIRQREKLARELLLRLSASQGVPNLLRLAKAVQRAARSPFLTGMQTSDLRPAGFIASFDWFLKPDTLTLIEEGQFDPPKVIQPPDPPPAKEVTKYWDPIEHQPFEFTPEEFFRTQVAGRLEAVCKTPIVGGRHIHSGSLTWATNGGEHPFATPEQVAEAAAWVKERRAKGELPSSLQDFKNRTKVPKTYKELREQRKEKEDLNGPTREPGDEAEEAAPQGEGPTQSLDDGEPW